MDIALVEDNKDLIDSLVPLLNQTEGLCCQYIFTNGEDALSALPELSCDLVIMDLQLPGINGVQCVEQLMAIKPELNILMYTAFDNSEDVFAALRAGACGYILKRAPFNDLLKAIKDAEAGGAPMSPHIARKVVRFFHQQESQQQESHQQNKPNNTTLEPLTGREHSILSLVAKGNSNKAIAKELDIANETVKVHLRNIYKKWQVNSRTQAIILFKEKQ